MYTYWLHTIYTLYRFCSVLIYTTYDKVMDSNIYGCTGKKGMDNLAIYIWRDGKVWTIGKTLSKKMLRYIQAQTIQPVIQ